MKTIGLLLLSVTLSVGAFAEDKKEEKTKEAPAVPLVRKVVGGLGEADHPAHPSSLCVLTSEGRVTVDHDRSADGEEVTTQKTKVMKYDDVASVQADIKESTAVKLEETKAFVKAWEPSVKYSVWGMKEFKQNVGGVEIVGEVPQELVIYEASGSEKKRVSDATDRLIEFADNNCPNSKPFDEITP